MLSLFLNRFTYRLGGEEALTALAVMRNAGGILGIYGTGIFGTDLMLGKIAYSEKNMGIRIVRGIARRVSYTGVFKTNNLMITF